MPAARRTITMAVVAVMALGCGPRPAEQSGPALAVVARRDITVSAVAAGVVEPITTVEVKSKASGEIIEVRVEEGDRVRPGQLLVRVDPRIPRNAVMQAEADSLVARAELDNAESQLERAEALRESQAITELEFENAKLDRAAAYAALVRARRTLEDAKIAYEDTEVRAPGHGVILNRAIEVGSVIASASREIGGGAVLLRMATLDTVQVRALVDETDIGLVQPGMPVTIHVSAFPNRRFTGEVLRIGAEAVVQQNVTMFPVLIRIANEEQLLRPGMNAEVEVHIGEVEDALAVPNAALRTPEDLAIAAAPLGLTPDDVARQLGAALDPAEATPPDSVVIPAGEPARRRGREYAVLVRRNGDPYVVPVRTGLTDYDYTAIRAGLEVGDTVYVLPTAGLLEEQRRREEWARERAGGPLPTGGGR